MVQPAHTTVDARASPEPPDAEPAPAPEPTPPIVDVPEHGQVADFTHVHSIYDDRAQLVTIPITRVPGRVPDAPALADQHERVGPLIMALHRALGLDHDQEHFIVMMCDARLRVYGFKHVASGGRHVVDVDSGMICRTALPLGATGIIAAHNHPSGNLESTRADRRTNLNLRRATSAVHIAFHDHIIHAPDGSYASMRALDPSAWPR